MSEELDTSIVLGLRVQDDIPDWINSLCYVDESGVKLSGNKLEILNEYNELVSQITTTHKSHVSRHNKQQQQQQSKPIEISKIIISQRMTSILSFKMLQLPINN